MPRDWTKSPSLVRGKEIWQAGDGTTAMPHEVVVPLVRRIVDRQYEVTGTGFFVTTYGLVATARHVLDDFVPGGGFALHLPG